jgi:hypothetical protein
MRNGDWREAVKARANAVTLSYTSTSAATSQLTTGVYDVCSSTDAHIVQGASTVTATTSGRPLWAKNWVEIIVDNATSEGYIAAIRANTSGTLYAVKKET